LEELREKAALAGLRNLRLKPAAAEDVVTVRAVRRQSVRWDSASRFQRSAQGFAEREEGPQNGGRLVNLDWKKEQTPFGLLLKYGSVRAKLSLLLKEPDSKSSQ